MNEDEVPCFDAKKLNQELNNAENLWRNGLELEAALVTIQALHSFSEKHIDPSLSTAAYHSLAFDMVRTLSGQKTELFEKRKRNPKDPRVDLYKSISQCTAAALLHRLMDDGVSSQEAARRVCKRMGNDRDFSLTPKQLINFRANLIDDKAHRKTKQMFWDMVRGGEVLCEAYKP